MTAMRVVRQDQRGHAVGLNPTVGKRLLVLGHVVKRQRFHLDSAAGLARMRAGPAAENNDVQQRVAHQAVASVNAAGRLARYIQVRDAGLAVLIN